jgi:hypothetical protein
LSEVQKSSETIIEGYEEFIQNIKDRNIDIFKYVD